MKTDRLLSCKLQLGRDAFHVLPSRSLNRSSIGARLADRMGGDENDNVGNATISL